MYFNRGQGEEESGGNKEKKTRKEEWSFLKHKEDCILNGRGRQMNLGFSESDQPEFTL